MEFQWSSLKYRKRDAQRTGRGGTSKQPQHHMSLRERGGEVNTDDVETIDDFDTVCTTVARSQIEALEPNFNFYCNQQVDEETRLAVTHNWERQKSACSNSSVNFGR